jgi:putative endonuclease
MRRKETGDLGEKLAQDFLKKKGYIILETKCRCLRVEIDIVARQKDCLVFVEVRTKSNLDFGIPEESITPTKIRHLEQAAMHYLQNHEKLPELWRLDLVAVELEANNKVKRIEHIQNAFECY